MLAITYNGYHDGIARTGWKMKLPATRVERGNLLSVKILTLKIITLKIPHSRYHTQEITLKKCTLPAAREKHGIAKH